MNDSNNFELLDNSLMLINKMLIPNSHIYWFTRWDKLPAHYQLLSKYFNIKNVLIWDKGNRGSGDLLGSYGNRYECIIYGMKGRLILNEVDGRKRHDDIIQISKVPASQLIHPHQKPIELLEFLLKKSTKEEETILDPFAGVASLILANKNLNRNVIAIELDPFYYDKGIERIKNFGMEIDEERIQCE